MPCVQVAFHHMAQDHKSAVGVLDPSGKLVRMGTWAASMPTCCPCPEPAFAVSCMVDLCSADRASRCSAPVAAGGQSERGGPARCARSRLWRAAAPRGRGTGAWPAQHSSLIKQSRISAKITYSLKCINTWECGVAVLWLAGPDSALPCAAPPRAAAAGHCVPQGAAGCGGGRLHL
jgi:hypothetical protein